MTKYISLFIVLFFIQLSIAQTVTNTKCDYKVNPVGIDAKSPKLSWQITATTRNTMQTAYEIRVATVEKDLAKGKNLIWATGKIASDQSIHIPYAGKSLVPNQKYYWQVRIWDNHGNTSPWSSTSHWQTGLMSNNGWQAKWITAPTSANSDRRSPYFRKTITIKKTIAQATIYATAHGIYETFINGSRVGDSYFAPGFTSYNKRLQYQAYDVTAMLTKGSNALGTALGSGWYRGYLGWQNSKNIYGDDIALLYQLMVKYTDGTSEVIGSDSSWKVGYGAIIDSEIYHGEVADQRLEPANWNTASFDDSKWVIATTATFAMDNIVPTLNDNVKEKEILAAKKYFITPEGDHVIDFGQNLVGYVKFKASGNAGDTIKIHHAEILDKKGNFYTANLRTAKQQNTYILKGNGIEDLQPRFTFQGFRYIRIKGVKGPIDLTNYKAAVLYSDMAETGSFTTSNATLNQLQSNIVWGQRGNFLDVPTDCPQRDERLGWTGDAQVFARTAAFNMDVNNFFRKWLKDLKEDQLETGSVPHVIPNVLGPKSNGSTGWADASTIIPWQVFQAYGDTTILADQYESMKAWVGYMVAQSKNDLWNTGNHFGDWLFFSPDDDRSGRAAITDKYLIAQCFFAYSTQLMVNTAQILNKPEDVAKYTELLKRVKAAFVKEYVTASGRLVARTQTAYVLALNFDMLPEELRAAAAARLVQNIKEYNYHLTTGFLGTPYLCHVLTRFGYHDIAYTLLMQDTYPSWLYPVKMGATTIWERWDGQKPDSTFQSIGMNSFNHYAYGAIGDWMYRVIGGLQQDDTNGVGYKNSIIRPYTNNQLAKQNSVKAEDLTKVATSVETPYGKLSSDWTIADGMVTLKVTIPANTKSKVVLPSKYGEQLTLDNVLIADQKIAKVTKVNADVEVELGSGDYVFRFK